MGVVFGMLLYSKASRFESVRATLPILRIGKVAQRANIMDAHGKPCASMMLRTRMQKATRASRCWAQDAGRSKKRRARASSSSL